MCTNVFTHHIPYETPLRNIPPIHVLSPEYSIHFADHHPREIKTTNSGLDSINFVGKIHYGSQNMLPPSGVINYGWNVRIRSSFTTKWQMSVFQAFVVFIPLTPIDISVRMPNKTCSGAAKSGGGAGQEATYRLDISRRQSRSKNVHERSIQIGNFN